MSIMKMFDVNLVMDFDLRCENPEHKFEKIKC